MISAPGGLGLAQDTSGNLPETGVEYVVGNQQGDAVLRPLRYPFYDDDSFPNGFTTCRLLFTNAKQDSLNNTKSDCDTNMTLNGQLGSPNLFDLVGFVGELDWGVSQADFNDFYSKSSFTWKFGQQTIFIKTKLTKIPQGIGPTGFNNSGTIITNGLPVVGNFFNFCTPDRKARRIDSVEQFRNEICACSALSITASGHRWWTYMLGILYSNI
jgi:hypothetical protein